MGAQWVEALAVQAWELEFPPPGPMQKPEAAARDPSAPYWEVLGRGGRPAQSSKGKLVQHMQK